ncbi:MAG TPA: SIS domain-containing protein [Victivallales bacterium]|nr:SIS domain-containing protein [Victivallales bacterium]
MDNKDLNGFFQRFDELLYLKNDIKNAYSILKKCFELNSTLFVCGNGGSAADSEHIVGELMKGFLLPRKIKNKDLIGRLNDKFGKDGESITEYLQDGLRTISLTGHPGLSTAYSNDVCSEMVFAQQLYVLSRPNDVLLAITTSGNSKNVLRAVQLASASGMKIILLTGKSGGKCAEIADCSIKVPSTETYRIQEYHLPIYHILCIMLEDYFYGGESR